MLWLIRAKRCPTLHFTVTTTSTKRHSLFPTWLHAYLEIVNSFLPISRLRCVQLDLLHCNSVLFPAWFIWEWRSRLYRVQFDCYISTAFTHARVCPDNKFRHKVDTSFDKDDTSFDKDDTSFDKDDTSFEKGRIRGQIKGKDVAHFDRNGKSDCRLPFLALWWSSDQQIPFV